MLAKSAYHIQHQNPRANQTSKSALVPYSGSFNSEKSGALSAGVAPSVSNKNRLITRDLPLPYTAACPEKPLGTARNITSDLDN
jgi:hypothetical protein